SRTIVAAAASRPRTSSSLKTTRELRDCPPPGLVPGGFLLSPLSFRRAPMRRSPATMGLLPGHPNGTPTAPSVTAASTRIVVTSPERAALFLPVGCQASIEGPAGTVRSRPGGPFCLLTVHLPLRQLGGLCALNARGPKGKIHHFRGLLSTSGDESR